MLVVQCENSAAAERIADQLHVMYDDAEIVVQDFVLAITRPKRRAEDIWLEITATMPDEPLVRGARLSGP